jgi:hypothetical protein
MSRKELIDKYLNKFVSRKLLAFIIATIGLFLGNCHKKSEKMS